MNEIVSKSPVVHAGLLGGIALVAAVFLIVGNMATKQSIKDRNHEDLVRSLEIVIPDRLHDNDLSTKVMHAKDAMGQTHKIYRARKAGKVTAVAFERFVNGYMKIHLIIGIDANGQVLGVRVLSHAETPGLVIRLKSRKVTGSRVLMVSRCKIRRAPNGALKKDGGLFDQFSGATITRALS